MGGVMSRVPVWMDAVPTLHQGGESGLIHTFLLQRLMILLLLSNFQLSTLM